MRAAAIDQGTTSTRVLVAGDDEVPRIVHQVEHRQIYPKQGWVEHDPEELIRHIEQCLEAAGKVDTIGIDNQGESCLAWDAETKEPLTNVIVWQDSRTQELIERMKRDALEAVTRERAGLPLDVYFSASKLRWILDHVPEAQRLHDKGRLRLGTTDAFFLDRLTGHCVTDVTTASRTSLMNLDTCEWDAELCRIFGVPMETLPAIVSTTGDFGAIRKTPVTASIVDQQASLYGHGCRKPGDTKITFGTGAFVLTVTGDQPIRDNHSGLLPTVAWRRQGEKTVYALDGGVTTAGSAVAWLKNIGLIQSYDELASFDGPPAIDRGLVFVPALSGLACPYWDRSAAALWIGMSLDTTQEDLVRAVLEGVAMRTVEVVMAMNEIVQVHGAISVDGGLTRSRYFVQFLADALQRHVRVAQNAELTVLGTLYLVHDRLKAASGSGNNDRAVSPGSSKPLWQNRFSEGLKRTRDW